MVALFFVLFTHEKSENVTKIKIFPIDKRPFSAYNKNTENGLQWLMIIATIPVREEDLHELRENIR